MAYLPHNYSIMVVRFGDPMMSPLLSNREFERCCMSFAILINVGGVETTKVTI